MAPETPHVRDAVELLGGLVVRVDGPDAPLGTPAGLVEAEPGQMSFCVDAERMRDALAKSRAGVLLVPPGAPAPGPGQTRVQVRAPRLAFALVLGRWFQPRAIPGIHPTAVVAPEASIDASATIGPFAVVEAGVVIGPRTQVGAHCSILAGVRIGAECRIGDGTRLGVAGYGYEKDESGRWIEFPQLGGLVIEDDVHIGANCTFARGALGDTRIGAGCRIDNLVHIAHNVRLGRGCMVVALAQLAGSVQLGDGAWVAPSATLREKVAIGAGAKVGLGAVVLSDVAPGQVVLGDPARDLRTYGREQAALRRTTEIRK